MTNKVQKKDKKQSKKFITKDSGKRVKFASGFQRDDAKAAGKPRYDLIPYDQLKRLAELYMRGAKKYDERNWEQATTQEEFNRFKESAFRHFMQWMNGEVDEDHASAVVFNVFGYEHLINKKNENK